MNDDARTNIGTPDPAPGDRSPDELRDQVERTRDELGKTVEALAAKADIKAQAKQKAAHVKDRAAAAARTNRTPLLLIAAAAAVILLVRRSRGRR
ncbi:DUF3618 domain-containing protein [Streptomyces vinaceus]|uniref:DUF3618 domain-containing protein n=1 Tax=Streptomyces vinaceus TaxID=1960 RepID=UPI00369257EA